jgi:hypothetical protein
MLDDLDVLRDAVHKYHVASSAAGLDWPGQPEAAAGPPPEPIYRIFDVDSVAEQVTWLYAQPWHDRQVLPDGGSTAPWPPDADALDDLAWAVGTPFPWRHQLTLSHWGFVFFTVVLAGEHEGEVWRYEISPDGSNPVRAATSLATLFDQWTAGIAAGALVADEGGLLTVEEDALARASGLDPMAFPVDLEEELLRQRQRECGVDLDATEEFFPRHESLLSAVAAVKASLNG